MKYSAKQLGEYLDEIPYLDDGPPDKEPFDEPFNDGLKKIDENKKLNLTRNYVNILGGTDNKFEEKLKTIIQHWRGEAERYRLHKDPVKAGRAGQLADAQQQILEEDLSPAEYKTIMLSDISKAPPASWLIDQVLPDTSLSILGGIPGVGKSLLALSMAAAIVGGRPLFGQFKVNRSGPVLIVDEENSQQHLGERARALRIQDLSIHFLYFQHVLLDDHRSFEMLIQVIEKLKPVQIFIDSLLRVHKAKENDATEMSKVMEKLREITNMGIGVCCLHHHGHKENRARGSSDIIGAIDLEYLLTKNADHLELHTGKTRGTQIEPMSLKIQSHSEGPTLDYLGIPESPADINKKREAVLSRIREPHTIEELVKLLSEYELPYSGRRLRPLLAQLVESGTLKEIIGAHGRKQFVPADQGE